MDTGCPYYNFDEMYKKYNKEPGTYSKIKISKTKYKNTILLLLSYQKNIIVFKKKNNKKNSKNFYK